MTRRKLSFYRSKIEPWLKAQPDTCPADVGDLIAGSPTTEKNLDIHSDAWGRQFVIKCGDTAPEGQRIGVLSLGPDGQEGTGDDLRTW